jgi:hypothetical protein
MFALHFGKADDKQLKGDGRFEKWWKAYRALPR